MRLPLDFGCCPTPGLDSADDGLSSRVDVNVLGPLTLLPSDELAAPAPKQMMATALASAKKQGIAVSIAIVDAWRTPDRPSRTVIANLSERLDSPGRMFRQAPPKLS